MSIIDRLQTLIRAEWNAVRPGGNGREDLRSTLQEAKAAFRSNRVQERQLASRYEDLLDDAQRWEDRAVEALRRNDEGLAREALRRKHGIDAEARDVRDALDRCRRELGDLRTALEALRMRADANRDRGHVPAPAPSRSPRHYGAPPSPPPRRPASLDPDASVDSALDRFDEMASRVDELEAEADADWSLDPGAEDRALNRRFERLETERSLDDLRARADAENDGDGGGDDDALRRLRERVDDDDAR